MSDFNPLNPNLDLSCKSLNQCLDGVQDDELMEAADRELSMLLEVIKALREDRERAARAITDLTEKLTKRVDAMCDIRDRLKPHMKPLSEWTSGPEDAIRTVLNKHFGIDIPR